jgi:flagellar biosynthesis protein FlhG
MPSCRPNAAWRRRRHEEFTVKQVMADQADGLRRLMAGSAGRLVAVVGSGPAVGATSVTLNLAAALTQLGKDVLLLDERSAAPPTPALRQGRLVLIDAVIDKDGALSPLAVQADHVFIVLQPNVASITAAYACIKRLCHAHALQRMRVLVNHAGGAVEAQRIMSNLVWTGSRYLAVALEPGGCVRADPRLPQAQRLNLTVVEAFPMSPSAMDFCRIAQDFLYSPRQSKGGYAPRPSPAPVSGRGNRPVLQAH